MDEVYGRRADGRERTMAMSDGDLGNGKTILFRAEDAEKYKTLADLDRPFTRGRLGILMTKGEQELLNYIHFVLAGLEMNGTPDELAAGYIG